MAKDKQMNLNPDKACYLISNDSDIKAITMTRYQKVLNLLTANPITFLSKLCSDRKVILGSFEIFLIFPKQVLKQRVYTMFITNNHVLFYLWRKEHLVKHEKVSKNYDHDCRQNNPLEVSDDVADK